MSDTDRNSAQENALAGLANRYEALVRDLGILHLLEETPPEGMTPDEISARLVGAIAREDGAEQCSVMLLDPQEDRLILRAVGTQRANRGFALPKEAWDGKQFSLGEGVAGRVADTRTPICIEDINIDSRFISLPKSSVEIRSLMCFPLVDRNKLLGVLNLSHSKPAFFTPDRKHSTWLIAKRASKLIGAACDHQQNKPSETVPSTKHALSAHDSRVFSQAERLHAIGKILNGVTQDLNRRLGQLVNLLDLALTPDTTKDPMKSVRSAREIGFESAEVLGRMNTFAQVSTTPHVRAPIDITGIFSSVVALVQHQCHPNDKIAIDIRNDLPVLQGDQTQLHLSFVNLCANALDAIARKRTTEAPDEFLVRLGAESVACNNTEPGPWGERAVGTYVRAYIADNGVGMPQEVLQQSALPFFTTKTNGTGLGLAIASHTARQHGGWLEIHSSPDNGTTVNFYLPVFVIASANGTPTESELGPDSKPTILLVDDEPMIRSMGNAMLKRLGYAVLLAESGAAAVELMQDSSTTVDLAIIDINMPGMGGLETLSRLRECNTMLPAILSSGDPTEEITAPSEGAPTRFLQKPYLIATLAELIKAALVEARRSTIPS